MNRKALKLCLALAPGSVYFLKVNSFALKWRDLFFLFLKITQSHHLSKPSHEGHKLSVGLQRKSENRNGLEANEEQQSIESIGLPLGDSILGEHFDENDRKEN